MGSVQKGEEVERKGLGRRKRGRGWEEIRLKETAGHRMGSIVAPEFGIGDISVISSIISRRGARYATPPRGGPFRFLR